MYGHRDDHKEKTGYDVSVHGVSHHLPHTISTQSSVRSSVLFPALSEYSFGPNVRNRSDPAKAAVTEQYRKHQCSDHHDIGVNMIMAGYVIRDKRLYKIQQSKVDGVDGERIFGG